MTDSAIAAAKQHSATAKTKAWEAMKQQDPQDYQLRKFRADYLAMLERKLTQAAA